MRAAGLGSRLAQLSHSSIHTDPARLGLLFRFTILLGFFSGRIALGTAGSGSRLAQLDDFSVRAHPACLGLRRFTILLGLFPGSIALSVGPGSRAGELNDFSVHAAPASSRVWLRFAIPLRFLLRRVALEFSGFGLRLGQLRDTSADADPAHFFRARTMLLRLFARAITLHASVQGRRGLNDLSVNAAPANFVAAAVPLRLILSGVTFHTSRLRLCLGQLNDISVNADPAHSFLATALCFFAGSKTSCASFPGLRLGYLDGLVVDADPALRPTATVSFCFVRCRITFETSFPRLRLRYLRDLSVNADPAIATSTVPPCFFLGRITLECSFASLRFRDLGGLPVNTDPAQTGAIPFRFFLRSVTLHAPSPRFCLGELDDPAVDADPAPSAVPARFLFGPIAWNVSFAGFGFSHSHDFSVQADPAKLAAILKRHFQGRIAPDPFLLRFGCGQLHDLSVQANPAEPATFPLRFFRRGEATKAFLPRLRFGYLHDSAVDADPAFPAIPLRFFLRPITLGAFLPGLRRRHLHHFSIEADPAKLTALLFRLLWRIVTLTAFRLAIGAARLDHLVAYAAPAGPAVLNRLFLGSVALAALRFAFRVENQDDASVDATVAIVRWRGRRRAVAIRRARQRPPPAMRRLRRARRVVTGTAMPLVTPAVCLPPPAATVLDPNPLATNIRPIAAIDRRGRE